MSRDGVGATREDGLRAIERLEALSETMRAFAEVTSDYAILLDTVVKHATRLLGDACLVALLSEDGEWLNTSALAARDESVTAMADAVLRAMPLRVDSVGIVMSVVRTGEPLFVPQIAPEEFVTRVAPQYTDLVRRVGVRGFLSVPLKAQGRTLGALASFRYRPKSPVFDESDLAFVQSLADHAAIAIVNGQLLDSARKELARRRQVEEEAKTFVALVHNSTDFIAMAAFDGRLLFVNDAGRKLLGIDKAQDIRLLSLADFHTEGGLARAEIIQREGSWQGEGVLRHFKTGEIIPMRVSSFIARAAGGEPLCFATVQHDLRETQTLETRLRQAQKMEAIGQLAGGIAHDFNNLLTVILSYSRILAEGLPKGSPEQVDVEQIDLAGQRAAALTRQLLALSRKQVLEPNVLDLNAVVTGMDRMVRRAVSENVEVRVVVASDLGKVEADKGQIEQVILNLVVNAGHAMPNGGVLTLATANVDIAIGDTGFPGAPPGAYVMLTASDTGVGIDAATMACIFEPFFTTKPTGQGTGLGLASVLGIIKQSDGQITVASELGSGTTFRVLLPRVFGVSTPLPQTLPVPARRTTLCTETILLVEDEAQVRVVMRNILARAGYHVLEAADPEAALAACEGASGAIDLLLTDVIMPKMSGSQLAERLREARPSAKVLYVSGYTENAIGRHGVLAPGTDLLRKPVTPDMLLQRVRAVLDA